MGKEKGAFRRFWDWYVKGCYHCDKCPYCWEERDWEGDCDCGCIIRGDIRDTCRLLPPFRFLIGWPRMRKYQYWESHQYDDIGESYELLHKREEILEKEILELLAPYELSYHPAWSQEWIGEDGSKHHEETIVVDKSELVSGSIGHICWSYEDAAHPYEYTPLKTEWKKLIKKTWNSFLDIFRPYFCK